MKINFIGHRHLIQRLLDNDLLPSGSAICFISSVAGMGWDNDLPRLQEFLATPDYAAAQDWVAAHEAEGIIHYGFSKKAVNAYVAMQAYPLLKKGIRINAICPGPTDTPLAQANADLWLSYAQDYRDETGSKVHTPEQMGDVMVFLNSAAAFGISGITLLVDYGHTMASLTGAYPPGKPILDLIMGRVPMPQPPQPWQPIHRAGPQRNLDHAAGLPSSQQCGAGIERGRLAMPRERESGGNPELSRSGMQERPPSTALVARLGSDGH